MKKLLLSLLLILPLCGFAQKGMQGVGVSSGFGKCYDLDCSIIDFSIKFQNHLTNSIRIVPHLGFLYADEYWGGGKGSYNCGLSYQQFLCQIRRFRPYATSGVSVGLGYEYDPNDETYYCMACFFDFGLGLDYRISYHYSFQIELLGLLGTEISDVLCFYPKIGLAYTF